MLVSMGATWGMLNSLPGLNTITNHKNRTLSITWLGVNNRVHSVLCGHLWTNYGLNVVMDS